MSDPRDETSPDSFRLTEALTGHGGDPDLPVLEPDDALDPEAVVDESDVDREAVIDETDADPDLATN